MSRSVFFLAASALALAACQPAEEATATLEAETPPIVEQPAEVEMTEVTADSDSAEAPAEVDHDGEDHEDGEDHDHEDHGDEPGQDDDHDHDADAPDEHGDEAHGDEDHDHAGGEAHVHGLSDLAASLDGSTLSISLEGALANFDLDETLRALDDTTPYTDGTVQVIGGDCTRDSANASIRPIGDHGNLMVDLIYTCSAADALEAIDVTGFQSFAGFTEVNAVYLTDAGQTAETLTENDTRLDLN